MMTAILVVLAFAAGYGTRAIQPRVLGMIRPPKIEDRNAGLARYQDFKNGG